MVNQRIWMHRYYAYACVCARSRLIVQFSFPPRWIGNGIEFQLHSNSIDQIHSHRTRSAAWCRPPYQFIILLFNSIFILISYRSVYCDAELPLKRSSHSRWNWFSFLHFWQFRIFVHFGSESFNQLNVHSQAFHFSLSPARGPVSLHRLTFHNQIIHWMMWL